MLTKKEQKELKQLEKECLDGYGKPRIDGIDTEKMVRLAELQEKKTAITEQALKGGEKC